MVEELTDDTFDARLAASERAVVDFFAPWCGPCMLFKPKLARLSDEYPHVAFFVVDGEKAPRARKTVHIDNLPYFVVYRNGVRIAGLTTRREDAFRAFIEQHFGSAP